jgi:hypothetical protein
MKGGREEEVSDMEGARKASKLGGDLEVRDTWVSSLVMPLPRRGIGQLGISRNEWVKA